MIGVDWDEIEWDPGGLAPELRDRVIERDRHVPPLHTLSVTGARRLLDEAYEPPAQKERVDTVFDTEIPGEAGAIGGAESVPVRIYRGDEAEDLPIMVWYHGGGKVWGDLDTTDMICRRFANAAGCVVISVDYRLAPEHKFPAAVEDCYAAVHWASNHGEVIGGDSDRLAIGGASAGGNLAAVISLLARDIGTPSLAYQWIVYPSVDNDFDRESYREVPVKIADAEWYADLYLSHPLDAMHPYVYPMKARSLGGLPPAEVLTVEFDPLRSEGFAYADRLEAAGVDVTHVHYDDMIHPFLNMGVEQANTAIDDAAERFREVAG